MNKRELLETQVVIGNTYLKNQLSKLFNRFKSKSVNREDLWFVIDRLYPTFVMNAKKMNLECHIIRKVTKGLGIGSGYTVNYILLAKEKQE